MNKSNSNTLKPLARRFAVVLLLTSLSAGGFAQFPLGGQATNGAQAVPSPQTNTGETPLFRAEQLMLTGSYAAASDVFQTQLRKHRMALKDEISAILNAPA